MAVENIADRSTSPAVSFYFNDFLAGTVTFSVTECGAYFLLLAYQWNSGSVPNDPVDRSRIMRVTTKAGAGLWARLRDKFVQGTDGQWRNHRMELERDKQERHRAAQVANGRKGGRPRTHGLADENPRVNSGLSQPLTQTEPKKSLSSSSSSSDLQNPSDSSDPSPALKSAPVFARARHAADGPLAGTLPRDHLNCHPPCIRVCISQKQHAILRERHGGTDGDLDAFYAEARTRIEGPVGMRAWEFWEAQFIARFGGTVDRRTAANAAAKAQFLARRPS